MYKKREPTLARGPNPWPSAHDAALFHTLRTSLTVSADRWSQENAASESMEAPSTPKIGDNALRVRVQGAKGRLVVAIAMAQAGYTTATQDSARNTGKPKEPGLVLAFPSH